jgi:hypothetical protein
MLYIESITHTVFGKLKPQRYGYRIINNGKTARTHTPDLKVCTKDYRLKAERINGMDFAEHELVSLLFKLYDDNIDSYITIMGIDILDYIKKHEIYGCFSVYGYFKLIEVPEYYRIIINNSTINIENLIWNVIAKLPDKDYIIDDNKLILNIKKSTGFLKRERLVKVEIPFKCDAKKVIAKLTKYKLLKGA